MLNQLTQDVHKTSLDKGFYANYFVLRKLINNSRAISDAQWLDLFNYLTNNEVCTKMLLIVTELSEIVEAIRSGARYSDEHVQEEFADVLIRFLDLCAFLDIDLDTAVTEKRNINNDRPYKHNKAF